MENETLIIIIIFKGIGMSLAILGGIIVANYGFRLYKDGAGSGQGSVVFEFRSVKVKAQSVGAVIMATACIWAWAGVSLSPNLEKKDGNIHIYSFKIPDLTVEAGALLTNVNISDLNIEGNPERVKYTYQDAFYKQASNQKRTLKINSQPARYVLDSIKVEQTNHGNYLLTATAEGDSSWASLSFEPTDLDGKLAFIPIGVDISSYDNFDPNQFKSDLR